MFLGPLSVRNPVDILEAQSQSIQEAIDVNPDYHATPKALAEFLHCGGNSTIGSSGGSPPLLCLTDNPSRLGTWRLLYCSAGKTNRARQFGYEIDVEHP